MPEGLIIDDNINLSVNELIVFRVRGSFTLYLLKLIGLSFLAVLVVMMILLVSGDPFFATIQMVAILFTLAIMAFMALVVTLDHFTTIYTLTTRRVQQDSGILRRNSFAIPLDEVANLDVRQGFIGLILNYGDIIIRSDSSEVNLIRFRNIENPKDRREDIENHLSTGNVVSMLD